MAIVKRRRKHGKVTFAAVVRVGGRQVWRTFKMQDEARRWEAAATVSRGSGWLARRMEFGAYLDEWFEAIKESVVRQTRASYRSACGRAKASMGGLVLEKLRAAQIQAHLSGLLSRGLKPSYVATDARIISTALNKAVLWGYIQKSPMLGVSRPRIERREFRVLDEEQARLFLAKTERESPYFGVYVMALSTGMRIGEILGTRWKDVDLPAKRISVGRSKTNAGVRMIDLPDRMVRWLMERPRGVADDPIFLGVNQNAVRADLKKYTDVRFHDLRHSHACFGLRAGVNPKIMQERLGHRRIGVTMDTYSHVLPGMQRQVADLMDDVLGR